VVVDGLQADEEQTGDLGVALAFDDELEDLPLAVSQAALGTFGHPFVALIGLGQGLRGVAPEVGLAGLHWTVMRPTVSVAMGRFVEPSESVRVPWAPTPATAVTVNGTDDRGGVPSPMSMLQTPEKVAVPAAGNEPTLGLPTTVMFRG
jgi:hypothetical protein